MITLMILYILFFSTSCSMILLNFILAKKKMKNREKTSPFECGFDPISNPRIPFSVQFFLISLMFLIFDVEISLLIPFTSLLCIYNYYSYISFFLFLTIMIISIYFEYLENMLEWKK